MSPQVWFITGTSTGIGRAVTEHLLEKGEIVVATLRTPSVIADLSSKYPASQLLVLSLDVTVTSQIATAFAAAKKAFGRIDVVYNNAAILIGTEVEAMPEDRARAMFDTNFWGATNVSKEAVRFFREENAPGVGGRLLVASTGAAVQAWPTIGHYSASKWALEGITEALYKELLPAWNIKVVLVEFGGYQTPMPEAYKPLPGNPAYNDPTSTVAIMRRTIGVEKFPGDPIKAARELRKLAHIANPPLRVPFGKDVLAGISEKVTELTDVVEKYGSVSDDLTFD